MHGAVELQKIYWGDDADNLVPAHMLYSIASFGGHVFAAMDGSRMVGVLVGFLGTDPEQTDRPAMANLLVMSKRMVVLPEYRNQGVAYRLKLAQRDAAIARGIRLVSWTFDPLLAVNAYFNFHKLGAVSHRYYVDYYGTDDNHPMLSRSDRLLVDWWVTNRRVEERIKGTRGELTLGQYLQANTVVVNPARFNGAGLPVPAESGEMPDASLALVEIPLEFRQLEARDAGLALSWRTHVREVMIPLLTRRYVLTDFVRGDYDGRQRAFYLFSYNMGFDYSMN